MSSFVLIVTEKSSVRKTLAEVIGGKDGDEYGTHVGTLPSGDKCVIVSCEGHVMRLMDPDELYPTKFNGPWAIEPLPFVPLKPNLIPPTPDHYDKDKQQQQYNDALRMQKIFNRIAKYWKKTGKIINACDFDRAGQAIFDNIAIYLGTEGKHIERLTGTSWSQPEVKKLINNTPYPLNSVYTPMGDADRARMLLDQLLGYNFTRLFTLYAQNVGYRDVMSVGRVQTCFLALVERITDEIDNFRPVEHYGLKARLLVDDGSTFNATVSLPDGLKNDEGYLTNKEHLAPFVEKLTDAIATVTSVTRKQVQEPPPKPFSLLTMPGEASRQYGLSPQDVLAIGQKLYLKGYITYPRSNVEEYSLDDAEFIPATLSGLLALDSFKDFAPLINRDVVPKTFIEFTTAESHSGIRPTATVPDLQKLDDSERKIYELVAHRYLLQFAPPLRANTVSVLLDCNNIELKSDGRILTDPGWERLNQFLPKPPSRKANKELPAMTEGDHFKISEVMRDIKRTSPPKPITEENAVPYMVGIHRYVVNQQLKDTLKDIKGLGQVATQAGVIELLLQREYMRVNDKKHYRITPRGRAMLSVVPNYVKNPDLTAIWEGIFSSIEKKSPSAQDAITQQIAYLGKLVNHFKENPPQIPPPRLSDFPCLCGQYLEKRTFKPRKEGESSSVAWMCPDRTCRHRFPNKGGRPQMPTLKAEHQKALKEGCPECGEKMFVAFSPSKKEDRKFTIRLGCSSDRDKCGKVLWLN